MLVNSSLTQADFPNTALCDDTKSPLSPFILLSPLSLRRFLYVLPPSELAYERVDNVSNFIDQVNCEKKRHLHFFTQSIGWTIVLLITDCLCHHVHGRANGFAIENIITGVSSGHLAQVLR